MGARNVKAVFEQWAHLPRLQFRVLVWMANSSLDKPMGGKPAGQYWGGRDDLATNVLGRSMPPSVADDESTSKENRKAALASKKAVQRVVRSLTDAGAIVRVGGGYSGQHATYALQGRGTVQTVPQSEADRGTVDDVMGDGSGSEGVRSATRMGDGEDRTPRSIQEYEVQEHSSAFATAHASEEKEPNRLDVAASRPEEEQDPSDLNSEVPERSDAVPDEVVSSSAHALPTVDDFVVWEKEVNDSTGLGDGAGMLYPPDVADWIAARPERLRRSLPVDVADIRWLMANDPHAPEPADPWAEHDRAVALVQRVLGGTVIATYDNEEVPA